MQSEYEWKWTHFQIYPIKMSFSHSEDFFDPLHNLAMQIIFLANFIEKLD